MKAINFEGKKLPLCYTKRISKIKIIKCVERVKRIKIVEQNNTCEKCNKRFTKGLLEIDHIFPISLGGSNDVDNLQILCKGCHSIKTRKDFKIISLSKQSGFVRKGGCYWFLYITPIESLHFYNYMSAMLDKVKSVEEV